MDDLFVVLRSTVEGSEFDELHEERRFTKLRHESVGLGGVLVVQEGRFVEDVLCILKGLLAGGIHNVLVVVLHYRLHELEKSIAHFEVIELYLVGVEEARHKGLVYDLQHRVSFIEMPCYFLKPT